MAIVFKKVQRPNPQDKTAPKKYYPTLITMGMSTDIENIAYEMKEKSSLSKGGILSVITNFVEAMRTALYNGHSVNIQNFGVFSLSAKTEGSEDKKECTAKKIKAVRINFRPSASVRPSAAATRVGEKIEFVDIQAYMEKKEEGGGYNPSE